jgi:group I intron endonuclease
MRIDHMPRVPGVYRITHVRSGRVYIGSTNNMRQRAMAHLSDLRRGKHANGYLQAAWNAYGDTAFAMEPLEIVSDVMALAEVEQKHMDSHCACDPSKGFNLLSQARIFTHTAETRRKIGDASRGRRHTPEAIEKMRQNARNRSPEHLEKITAALRQKSPEHLAKLGAAHRGKVISEEQRRKQSEATRGRKQSPEHIAARRAVQIGRRLSPEHRAAIRAAKQNISDETRRKISEAQKGRRMPEKTKAALLAAVLGCKRSPETRARMSEAAKRRYARQRAENAEAE